MHQFLARDADDRADKHCDEPPKYHSIGSLLLVQDNRGGLVGAIDTRCGAKRPGDQLQAGAARTTKPLANDYL